MNCNEADSYIMKYMDGEITEDEAHILNEHLLECSACKESFYIYDTIMTDFANNSIVRAPEGFEIQVMAKISVLNDNEIEVRYRAKDKIHEAVWGTFTILFASGTVLVIYRDHIINSLLNNPYIGDKIQLLIPVAKSINYQADAFKSATTETVSYFNSAIANSMGVIFAVLAILCTLQFFITKRKGKTNKAEVK